MAQWIATVKGRTKLASTCREAVQFCRAFSPDGKGQVIYDGRIYWKDGKQLLRSDRKNRGI